MQSLEWARWARLTSQWKCQRWELWFERNTCGRGTEAKQYHQSDSRSLRETHNSSSWSLHKCWAVFLSASFAWRRWSVVKFCQLLSAWPILCFWIVSSVWIFWFWRLQVHCCRPWMAHLCCFPLCRSRAMAVKLLQALRMLVSTMRIDWSVIQNCEIFFKAPVNSPKSRFCCPRSIHCRFLRSRSSSAIILTLLCCTARTWDSSWSVKWILLMILRFLVFDFVYMRDNRGEMLSRSKVSTL